MADIISNALNNIMNSKRARKSFSLVTGSKLLINLINIAKKHGYVKDFKIQDEKTMKMKIELGKLNECKAIKPRFYVTKKEIEKYVRRYLPSRDFGILIVSTNKGLLTHEEAIEKNIGGSLIAYFF
ncbi:30S ribosomal protein S8 [Candidatus Pacearchaeota archaeon]|nr:30S ribosomal protein S8 [Candidatus Pacearchaeota archaeon]